MTLEEMKHSTQFRSDLRNRQLFDRIYNEKAQEEAEKATLELLNKRRRKRNALRQAYGTLIISESQPYETFVTNDTHESSGNSNPNIASASGGEFNLSLDKFFERPILIDDFLYQPNQHLFRVFNPFVLWTRDPTVRTKLSHYAYMRGNLKIRIVTSSSRFHFGSTQVSFQPYAKQNRTLESLERAFGDAPNLVRTALNNYLSQSPERALLQYGRDNIIEMTFLS